MIRCFRSTDAVYESVRAGLDAAWGFPNPETKTATAFDPAATAPHDEEGRVYLVVSSAYCEYEAVAAALPDLLAAGAVTEISEAEYQSQFPLPARP